MEKLLIFAAPSGAGKTTLVKHLLSKRSDLAFSASATSREGRPNGTDGKDYYFIGAENFKAKIERMPLQNGRGLCESILRNAKV